MSNQAIVKSEKDNSLSSVEDPRDELCKVELDVKIAKLKRQKESIELDSKLHKWNEIIGFVVAKCAGVFTLSFGLIE